MTGFNEENHIDRRLRSLSSGKRVCQPSYDHLMIAFSTTHAQYCVAYGTVSQQISINLPDLLRLLWPSKEGELTGKDHNQRRCVERMLSV